MGLFSKIFGAERPQEQHTLEEVADRGWSAIDEITDKIYPSLRLPSAISPKIYPNHDATGKHVLYQASVFDLPTQWLYVSYGCSELFEKEWSDPNVSGLGYELTFRLSKKSAKNPPVWPMVLMNDIAYYGMEGAHLGPGHSLNFGRAIDENQTTRLTGILLANDPELPPIETENGKLYFLLLYGIDEETLLKIKQNGSSQSTVSEIALENKDWITVIE
ncbi:suppressor of fused domain protein [Leptospira gomenensis]|uniref:Suppressor of fused domain protein n=1 Tax=Leptospira gomenensis TaxID=2484974 RepID=A0A5F1YRW0_9LEPT|nr:suppressor of fused domain protein [Leptospira gomenensis]TGK38671.1 suppressor of fused domain protein [Leptospira gomenensis]TGK44339.1 suppressor of fused domain protein [Leptospira gomenensis]TGK49547.1 suppressor of fused domain protein [Leptospira gomenensis]TGK60783.1 suppressor of fused domain protein [Leptospira gomenensis]